MSENGMQQAEEVEALSAIYDTKFRKESDTENSYCMQVNREVQLFITFNPDYPSSKPPSYQLLAPTISGEQKQCIYTAFDDIYRDNLGGPVLFQWIEKLKEIIGDGADDTEVEKLEEEEAEESPSNGQNAFDVVHGSVIKDRKSIFQGHTCSITSQQQIKDVMEFLMQNKKIAQATHNILAYRICLPNGLLLQDFDDDGETHAGGRLLHLLQILDVTNVMVVVTRWYGGIHLGPDRFRHINNSARQVLQQAGFLKSNAD